MSLSRFFGVLFTFALLFCLSAQSQTLKIAYQGGEGSDCWGYSATDPQALTLETANPRTGTHCLRMGGSSANNTAGYNTTLTMNPVKIAAFQNVKFRAAFRTKDTTATGGEGWDNNEALRIEANIDNAGWQTVAQASGGGNYVFNWNTQTVGYGACCQSGTYNGACGFCFTGTCGTCQNQSFTNPVNFTVPANANTIQFRFKMVNNAGKDTTFNRMSEFYFVDDISLTGTPKTALNPVLTVNSNPSCAAANKKFKLTNNGAPYPAGFGYKWKLNATFFGLANADTLDLVNMVDKDTVIAFITLCDSLVASDTIVMTIIDQILADAGAAQTVCDAASVTLTGNTPIVGTGTWTKLGGPNNPTIVAPNSATTDVQGVVPGVYIFQWGITDANCDPALATVQITVLPDATADGGGDKTVCGITTDLQPATPPTGYTGAWSSFDGPGFVVFNGNNVVAGVEGVYRFIYTVSGATCSAKDTVTVRFDELNETAKAGKDTLVCKSPYALKGVLPNGLTGHWTIASGLGGTSLSNLNDPNAALSMTQSGDYLLVWTLIKGVCTVSDSVYITYDVTGDACISARNADWFQSTPVFAPNPLSGVSSFRFALRPDSRVSEARIEILDLQGRLATALVQPINADHLTEIIWQGNDAMNRPLPNGLYLFRLTAGAAAWTGKIQIQK